MAKIKEFNKSNASEFHAELAAVITKLAEKHGLSLKKTPCSYSSNVITKKLEVFVPDKSAGAGSELVSPKLIDAFKVNCHLVGLKKSDLGKTFVCNGVTYKVAGINTRKIKNSIVLVNLDKNCISHCNENLVKRMLNA